MKNTQKLDDALITELLAKEAATSEKAKDRPAAPANISESIQSLFARIEAELVEKCRFSMHIDSHLVGRQRHYYNHALIFTPNSGGDSRYSSGIYLIERNGIERRHWKEVPDGILTQVTPLLYRFEELFIELDSKNQAQLAALKARQTLLNSEESIDEPEPSGDDAESGALSQPLLQTPGEAEVETSPLIPDGAEPPEEPRSLVASVLAASRPDGSSTTGEAETSPSATETRPSNFRGSRKSRSSAN